MLDIKKILIDALNLSKNMALDPLNTATQYNEKLPTWKHTFFKSYVPITIFAVIASFVLSVAVNTYGFSLNSLGYFLEDTIYQIIFGSLSILLFAAIFSFLAKYFDGHVNFDAAVATLALSFLPYVLVSSITSIPLLGWIAATIAFFYTFYILYQITPIMMKLTFEKRVPYLIVAFVTCIIVTVPFSMLFYNSASFFSTPYDQNIKTTNLSSNSEKYSANIFGDIFSDQKYLEAAENDRYSPPKNGKVSEKQVKKLVYVNQKTSEIRDEIMAQLEKYDERINSDDLSWGEQLAIGKKGMAIGTAEMRVVKSGNGNWAEHEWVKEQLRNSLIHHDSNPIAAHNYKLYQKYESSLYPSYM